MEEKLIMYLEHMEKLLSGMLELAERQQSALIRIDTKELEQITNYQNALAKNLRETEQQRIKYIMSSFNISLKEASVLPLSFIERKTKSKVIADFRKKLAILTTSLYNLNITNRVLANRAKNSVKEIFSVFSNGSNHVCNVKI
jgi:flagellar biosynthesis/type III secretory pathway chaperone